MTLFCLGSLVPSSSLSVLKTDSTPWITQVLILGPHPGYASFMPLPDTLFSSIKIEVYFSLEIREGSKTSAQ